MEFHPPAAERISSALTVITNGARAGKWPVTVLWAVLCSDYQNREARGVGYERVGELGLAHRCRLQWPFLGFWKRRTGTVVFYHMKLDVCDNNERLRR